MNLFTGKKKQEVFNGEINNEKGDDLLTGFLTNLGCCIFLLQLVESQISLLMNHLGIKENGKEIDWIKDGKSLGYRIKEMEKSKILPKDVGLRIDEFRKARNETVHALVNKKDFSIFDREKLTHTYLQVRQLRIEAGTLLNFFSDVITTSALQSLTTKEKSTVASIQSIIRRIGPATISS